MKKLLFLLVIGVVLCSSCERKVESLISKKATLEDIRSIHLKMKNSVGTLFSDSYNESPCDFNLGEEVFDGVDTVELYNSFIASWSFVESNSVELLYENSGLNPLVIDAAQYYIDNVALSDDIYSDILTYIGEFTESEWEKILLIVEIYDRVTQCYGEATVNGEIQDRTTWWCALAVAGSIVHTLSAVTVVTPVGLGFWLVGKAIATAGIIGSCT